MKCQLLPVIQHILLLLPALISYQTEVIACPPIVAILTRIHLMHRQFKIQEDITHYNIEYQLTKFHLQTCTMTTHIYLYKIGGARLATTLPASCLSSSFVLHLHIYYVSDTLGTLTYTPLFPVKQIIRQFKIRENIAHHNIVRKRKLLEDQSSLIHQPTMPYFIVNNTTKN